MSTEWSGSAFPNNGAWANNVPEGGLSKREYFAAEIIRQFLDLDPKIAAARAFQFADALVEEGKKT